MLPLIACHSPHWNNSLFTSCIITEFCMTFSLALNNWGQKYQKITRLQGEIKIPSAVIFFLLLLSLSCFNMFISFNFFIPALLGIVFLCCRVFEIVKVGSSTLLAELSFWHAFTLLYESFVWQTFTSLASFTFARFACPLPLWIKTSYLNYSIWPMPK